MDMTPIRTHPVTRWEFFGDVMVDDMAIIVFSAIPEKGADPQKLIPLAFHRSQVEGLRNALTDLLRQMEEKRLGKDGGRPT